MLNVSSFVSLHVNHQTSKPPPVGPDRVWLRGGREQRTPRAAEGTAVLPAPHARPEVWMVRRPQNAPAGQPWASRSVCPQSPCLEVRDAVAAVTCNGIILANPLSSAPSTKYVFHYYQVELLQRDLDGWVGAEAEIADERRQAGTRPSDGGIRWGTESVRPPVPVFALVFTSHNLR